MEKWAGGELRGVLHLIAMPVMGGPYALFEKKVKLIIWPPRRQGRSCLSLAALIYRHEADNS